LQVAGLGGNVRYIFPAVAYKRFTPMNYFLPDRQRAQRPRHARAS
jgi:hypothetical protein